jgi:hypothetical protein
VVAKVECLGSDGEVCRVRGEDNDGRSLGERSQCCLVCMVSDRGPAFKGIPTSIRITDSSLGEATESKIEVLVDVSDVLLEMLSDLGELGHCQL